MTWSDAGSLPASMPLKSMCLKCGIAAGELVRIAAAHIDGKGGGRPEMAQGKGSRRDGLAAALEAISAALGASNGSG